MLNRSKTNAAWRGLGFLACVATLLACGCKREGDAPGQGQGSGGKRARPVVHVVNYPLQYFTERIGGESVEVIFPTPGDVDPAHWMPDRQAIKGFQIADLIILNGADYAKWLDKVSLPESKQVDTSRAFKMQLLKVEEVVTHSHGKGGEHSHVGTASHTWLNPRLAVLQAEAIRDALKKLKPAEASTYDGNFESLKADLMALDSELDSIVRPQRDRPIAFSHPIYQYFQQRFAVNSRNLNWAADEVPDKAQWKAFDELRVNHALELVVWETRFMPKTHEELDRRGVKSVVFDVCSNAPEQGDFLSVMRRNAASLKDAYSGANPAN